MIVLAGCGGPLAGEDLRAALTQNAEIATYAADAEPTSGGAAAGATLHALAARSADPAPDATITVDDPIEGSVFPADFTQPTFLWHDPSEAADAWFVRVEFASGAPLLAMVAGPPPEQGWVDPRAFGETNSPYEPTEYQASAHAWRPSEETWHEILRRSVDTTATVTFAGFRIAAPDAIVSRGTVHLTTSSDPVDGTVFYRDVPLMPAVSDVDGKIRPLSDDAIPVIEWRLRDLSRPESKVILTGMPTCANCHSFSKDGKTFAMDVDGPTGDKGAYGMAPVARRITLDDEHVLTWNSFDGKEGPGFDGRGNTIGFLSRISPDGQIAVSTLNEQVYVENFPTYRFVQVFYPTRGILAWTRGPKGHIRALPGADDKDYVHCDPVWTPDGRTIVFARARAFDPPPLEAPRARYPNDPLEPQIRYDLYRIPFADGQGGTPEPIAGASQNGMSNTFPKVTPDGRFVVFVKCKNGQLLRPDSELWMVPIEGGTARRMNCNTSLMNSWHSFSPNGRWMVFTSKVNTPYTQLFLTHLDADGNDTPPVLVPHSTAANRAVNLPEFAAVDYDALDEIAVPAVGHDPGRAFITQAEYLISLGQTAAAIPRLERALLAEPESAPLRTDLGWLKRQAGEEEAATALFRRALEIDPAAVRARGGLAVSDRPVAELEARVVAAPNDAAARRALANAHLAGGREQAALAHLGRLASTSPDDVASLLALAWTRAASHDVSLRDGAAAVTAAERACALTENADPEALDALAAALAEVGNPRRAAEVAARAMQLAEPTRPGLAQEIGRRRALYVQGRALPW